MRYAKLINNNVQYAPNPILIEDNYIGNPPIENYLEEGYKPVIYTEQPELQGSGYYKEVWKETETNIIQDWEWIDGEESEETL